MAKVIMTCGRICSGKSTYAAKLRSEYSAAVLSVDEITLALFGQDAGDMHDEYVSRAEKYLYRKSTELIRSGINVVLDWGFWTRSERDFAREFYRSENIVCELHYIHISDEQWRERISKRNSDVLSGTAKAYFIDEGLAEKFSSIFEPPSPDEIDVTVE